MNSAIGMAWIPAELVSRISLSAIPDLIKDRIGSRMTASPPDQASLEGERAVGGRV